MCNIAKIKLDEKEKEEIKQYKESLLNYLEILNEVDINLEQGEIIDNI